MGQGRKNRSTNARLLRDIKRTRAKKVGPSSSVVTERPNRFQHVYGAEALADVGPFLNARWTVPAALATEIEKQGRTPPNAVGGPLLIDTGATTTHISEKAAKALGLNPIRIVKCRGISGVGENNLYFARLEIGIHNPVTGQIAYFVRELEAMGVPDIEQNLYKGRECVGLLGRDVLRFARFNYDGLAGSLDMVIDYATMEAAHPGSVSAGPWPPAPAVATILGPVSPPPQTAIPSPETADGVGGVLGGQPIPPPLPHS